jgi:putative cell wall-binding protein
MKRKNQSAREAAELRTLGKRLKGKKNLFGFGRGEDRGKVARRKRSEARKFFEAGEYRAARRTAKMSLRKYARRRGVKLEGRLRGALRARKERARGKAHRLVEALFGTNPPAVKKNAIPLLLSALGEGAGFAAGDAAFRDLTRRKSVKKKKKSSKKKSYKRAKARSRPRPRPRKKIKRNPPRRVKRITHALGVGRSRHPRIVATGTKGEMKRAAKLLRAAGVRNTQIGRRA